MFLKAIHYLRTVSQQHLTLYVDLVTSVIFPLDVLEIASRCVSGTDGELVLPVCVCVCSDAACCNRKRIFGLSSATQPPRLDVGKNVSDDLAEVGGTQRAMLQVLTVSPETHSKGQTGQSHDRTLSLCV